MNTYSRANVIQISEYLHLCMVKAIDTALTSRIGANWFLTFKEIDSKKDRPILENHYTSVHSMDLQSCFKFFRYGDDYAKIVLEFYGNNFYIQNNETQQAEKQLHYLLNNLINNVRNDFYAHASAGMIENGVNSSVRYSVYGFNEAVNDMIKFASFFRQVTDADGVSYYDKMRSLSNVKNSYSVKDTIKHENLKVDVGTFVNACNALNITIQSGYNGELMFTSSNYVGDVAQIKLSLNQKNSKKSKLVLILVIAIAVIVASVVTLVVTLSGDSSSDNTSTTQTEQQAETEVTTEAPANTSNHIYGEGTKNDLTLTIDQEVDSDIIITYKNNSTTNYSFNYGGSPSNIIVQTESGEIYSAQYPGKPGECVYPGDKGKFILEYKEEFDSPIVSVTCRQIEIIQSFGFPFDIEIPIEYK